MRRALYPLLALGVLALLVAFGSKPLPPFVKLRQMGKTESDVYVNRNFVIQIRPGFTYDSMVIFSTGAYIEVQGPPAEIEAKLEN